MNKSIKPAARTNAKPPVETVSTVGDLAFDHGQHGHDADAAKPATSHHSEVIHASECVVNSECTLTPECRGRLRMTNAVNGNVQIYCPKCQQFAAGTRLVNGLVSSGGGKLFDRVAGK